MYAYSTIRAARSLHKQILETIIRCPMSFFDITPIGRILNRFSRDIDVVDNTLGFVTRRVLQIAFQTIGTIIIVGYSTPDFLIVVIPVLIVYYFIQVNSYMPSLVLSKEWAFIFIFCLHVPLKLNCKFICHDAKKKWTNFCKFW